MQTDGNTVKTVMQPSYIMPYKPLAAKASIFNGCCLQRMLSSISTFSYMMPSKPLAAKASVFKLPKQLSSTATSYMMSCRQSLRNQTLKTDFSAIFLKCWASSMATLWAWRVHLGFVRTSPAGGESGQEISSTTQPVRRSLLLHQPLLRQQPGRMVTAPPTSLPRLRPVRVPKLAPAILRQVRAPCRARRLLSQAAGRR